jgi:prepilin-type N-terminal cleavage/methylation domain-containing protein/prepilin-type processing-associated H-X9-DG protein
MKTEFPFRSRSEAFTLTELMVVIVLLGLMAMIFLGSASLAKIKSARIQCVHNLKNIGLAIRIFEEEPGEKSPVNPSLFRGQQNAAENIVAYRVFRELANEFSTPEILICPADRRKEARNIAELRNENISYFLGLPEERLDPAGFLAGDRNLAVSGAPVKPGLVTLFPDAEIGWTSEMHQSQGNVAMMDGSVQQSNNEGLGRIMRKHGVPVQIMVP